MRTSVKVPKTAYQGMLSKEVKDIIMKNAYLGKKGYTIPKACIQKEDYDLIKQDLIMTPFTMGGYGKPQNTSFPIFRENSAKLYVPRFYGIQEFGMPAKSEIQTGEPIDLDFSKDLRDYQTKVVNIYLDYVNRPICDTSEACGGGGILELPCGYGKTVLSLKIISDLKKKTLILVHKEFLMNQWIERITEFLPSARVGKIQGPVFDVEGRDIVIGMIQTLHSRDFPSEAFASFGLTVIDEVHRIGSEEFSKTLLKAVTPYMLGISATVERKDRLTKILYMFIGKKIFSINRDDGEPVHVRAIHYKTSDAAFNETEYDFRGNPKYSTMITKLCEFGPRSDFIIRVIQDLLDENPEKQIMVLAHNRALLTYLHDAVLYRISSEPETVGYYVGGMKEKDLKITEGKKIVLATYAMAAEALDIKTLSTLVMASPKTDIEQSVGRILRTRGQNPIVVDIVDSHDYLKRQWQKRKTFYKKCNYKIFSTVSTEFQRFHVDAPMWKLDYDPKTKVKEEPKHKCLINISFDD